MFRLSRFKVTGLPFIGPQEIKFDPESDIYFLMGANGTGKTHLLKMVYCTLGGDWEALKGMIFSIIEIEFLDLNQERKIFLVKKEKELILSDVEGNSSCPLVFDNISKTIPEPEKKQIIQSGISSGFIEVLGCGHWKALGESTTRFDHMRDMNQVISYLFRKDNRIAEPYKESLGIDIYQKFIGLLLNEGVFFIGADRTQKRLKKEHAQKGYVNFSVDQIDQYFVSRVFEDINFLSKELSLIVSEYEEDINQGQINFIDDLTRNSEVRNNDISINELKEIYSEYEKNTKSFSEIGVSHPKILEMPEKDNPHIWIIGALIDNYNKSYRKNFSERISYFHTFFSFLKNAIPTKNFEFVNNRIIIRPKLDDSAEILPEYLSSGEQQLVILGYEILSACNSNSLILIDEPELSMDPAMKSEFVELLEKAAELRNSRYLLATHSHMVVGKNRDEVQILTWEGNSIDK